MRRRILALAAVMGVLAGCSGPGHHSSAPSTSLSPQTAASPNPDVIPPVITPAYVNAVFAVLNHINGNAVRALLAAGSVTPTVEQDLRAIFSDPLYSEELKIAAQTLSQGTADFRVPPGDIVTTVKQLISASPRCVFVETSSNFQAVVLRPQAPAASEYWVLKPKSPDMDPSRINPTPWGLSFNASYASPTTIPDQCGVS